MIHINIDKMRLDPDWIQKARDFTEELKRKPANERSDFIKSKRAETWGSPALLLALQSIAGNKCWYSEVPLEGADPNVDHFRPKGDVREIDSQLKPKNATSPGYWWLAFEYRNYRLCCMHSNQRRVDENTDGGKWDFFPVRGSRAPELTEWGVINEDVLVLDPCSFSDVALLWFDPSGNAGCVLHLGKRSVTKNEQERVAVTIWLYHLNKGEISQKRAAYLDEIRKDLLKADAEYRLWNDTTNPSLCAKRNFDQRVAEIKKKIADDAPFAGAKRCAIRTAIVEYEWIEEFHII